MLQDQILLVVSLLMAVSLLTIISEKVRMPYPIFLVLCGLVIGFIPNVLDIVLDPEIVFLVFLPPILFAAAWNTSWKDFWSFRRSISLLAFGLVIFTSCAVALVSKSLIPGFTFALGFLLGGIISPTDAVAATSILRKMKMPKRVVDILEGESLVNDAAGLIVFRFAIAAIITGQFTLREATFDFIMVAAAGIGIGLAVAFVIYAIHRFLPTTSSIDTAITLISPYLMYIIAERFHVSGILAVVSGGLFLSARATEIFTYETRIQSQGVWDTLVFLLNGTIFILIGLQLPVILSHISEGSVPMLMFYGVIISLVAIIVRLLWVFPGTYIPRLISKRIREKEPRPSWKAVFIVGWSGMRGVVSLAAALSIPLSVGDNMIFPFRYEIMFITFVVILITLVVQGLTLPLVIRKLNLVVHEKTDEMELEIQLYLVRSILNHLDEHYAHELQSDKAFTMLRDRYHHFATLHEKQLQKRIPHTIVNPRYTEALLDLVEVRRRALGELRAEDKYPDELIRSAEKWIDHEEARLRVTVKED
jgi:Na+/H+ antiporter